MKLLKLVQYSESGEPNAVYCQFVNAMLLNEVQKQHEDIETQQMEIDSMKSELKEIKSLLVRKGQ